MKTITAEMIRSWELPYDDPPLGELVPENWTGTALDILNLPIRTQDKLWAVLREGILPEATLREFARWCALQVIHLWDAPEVVRKYLETGDETLRDAVWDAASAVWGAKWTVAGSAAASAAWSVVWNVASASASAQNAAWRAMLATVWDAPEVVQDVVQDATLDAQVEKLKEMIKLHLAD